MTEDQISRLVDRLEECYRRLVALALDPSNPDPAAAWRGAVEAVRGLVELSSLRK